MKSPKSFENRRQGKLTISQALNDDNEKGKIIGGCVKRAREKAKLRNLTSIDLKDSPDLKEKKKEIIIPDFIVINELSSRMG